MQTTLVIICLACSFIFGISFIGCLITIAYDKEELSFKLGGIAILSISIIFCCALIGAFHAALINGMEN